jgi:hypothetical protein
VFDAIFTNSLRVGVSDPALEAGLFREWDLEQFPIGATAEPDRVPGSVLVAGVAFGSPQDGASR